MLDDSVILEPYLEPGDFATDSIVQIPPTDPPILIPAIDADGSYYPVEKIEAHVRGLHHLAISAFVFDGPHLLIQKRAMHKYHCGGQWANTCCTHPHWNEDAHSAANRRLGEELGFEAAIHKCQVVEYSADVGNGLWEKERVHLFRADASRKSLSLNLNPDEVDDVRWITADELRQEIRSRPEQFTPWFKIYLNRFPDLAI